MASSQRATASGSPESRRASGGSGQPERTFFVLDYYVVGATLRALDGAIIRSLGGGYGEAAFSPDGRRLAYTSYKDGNPDLWFLDLETGGLASSPVFLAGTMHWNGEDFVLRQYFATVADTVVP